MFYIGLGVSLALHAVKFAGLVLDAARQVFTFSDHGNLLAVLIPATADRLEGTPDGRAKPEPPTGNQQPLS